MMMRNTIAVIVYVTLNGNMNGMTEKDTVPAFLNGGDFVR